MAEVLPIDKAGPLGRLLKVSETALAHARTGWRHRRLRSDVPDVFRCPNVPRATIDPDRKMAQDSLFYADFAGYLSGAYEGYNAVGFLGYPILSELSQRAEYRMMTETTAEEMLREGFDVVSRDEKKDDDRAERIRLIKEDLEAFGVRALLQKVLELDGYFGRGQIYVDTGASEDRAELKEPLFYTDKTVRRGSLRGLKCIEPIWSYPMMYNSNNPLRKDFFVPQTWTVMDKEVHRTRLLTVASRKVPDILKPAYSFGGLSMTQLAQAYVNNWVRTRDSIGDVVHSFSTAILKTDMSSVLQGQSGEDLFRRLDLFNATRDNRGVVAINKDSEEMQQINTPLTGLDDLQAQAQEQLCSVSHTPVIKLLGLTPKGLNTSTDGEMVAWDDYIAARQTAVLDDPVRAILKLVQLNRFGAVDDGIIHSWKPLRQMDGEARARIVKTTAEAHQIYEQMGAVSGEEVRASLAVDPDGPYRNLDPDDMPEPSEESEGGEPTGEEGDE